MAWVLLLLSCYIVPRTWQDKVERREARGFRAWLRDLAYGGAVTRAYSQSDAGHQPGIGWWGAIDSKWPAYGFSLVATGWLAVGKLRYPHGWDDQVTFVVMGFGCTRS